MDSNAIQIREKDFEFWLNEYSQKYSDYLFTGSQLCFDDKSPKRLNDSYWELRKAVKDKMLDPNSRVNCFKVISGVQSIILFDQPFESPIESAEIHIVKGVRRINSEFAFNVALSILISFYEKDFEPYAPILVDFFESNDFIDLKEFHLDWSELLDFPLSKEGEINFHSYFLLAQFWQTLYYWLIEYLKRRI